ncbi:carnitine acetyl transferase [Sistotremastrum suecicum HHB10207 ss-3]|uniref:Carnitine acetyl transferase n=1 Tax=Sistotremastrum suecicum HHB10207 ss-3 TaxID=1314776 RepID=A0A166I687_9AGAM|nr:carnitine acetyl transferase [Sistotremastrum suecicum HHB10207 ss-3]
MATRSAHWKSLAPFPPAGTPTFAQQQSLEKLPVPRLDATFDKLKKSLRPLAWSDEEYNSTIKKVDEFGNGLASELQKRLEVRRNEEGRDHWLEEWWDDAAYLSYRDSVVVNVSYYYGFTPHPEHLPQGQVNRAAALTRSALLFRQNYKQGLMEPDMVKEGPLCMDTWRWMFDCCRVPGLDSKDFSVSYASEDPQGTGGSVIVLRKGRIWKINAGTNGSLLSTAQLKQQFQYIIDHTSQNYPDIGVFTAWNRDEWANAYAELISDSHNEEILREIHRSAFVVCLDSGKPEGIIDFSRALWHGGVHGEELGNRWCDKPCQFIVFENGKAGIMGEHSIMDGTPVVRLTDNVVESLHDPNFDHGAASSTLPPPAPLDWNVSDKTQKAIVGAKEYTDDLVNSQTMGYVLTDYGKDAIKAFGVSPDSWTQMIIQLAFWRLNGGDKKKRLGGTYEAATTRRFLKGRTECVRIVTSESDAFCMGMDDKSLTDDERKKRLQTAAKLHIQHAKEAGKGQGVDRHLMGLRKSLKDGEELPALYSDPLFQRSSKWVLSTSAIWSKHFPSYGWGEVVPDGFGVAYMTGYPDRLQFTITSRKEMPNARFCEELTRAANDMRALFVEQKSRL